MATLLIACGGGAAHGKGAEGPVTAHVLYPLEQDNVWSYDVQSGDGLPTLAITRVTRVMQGQAEVSSGGQPVTYQMKPEGLWKPATSTWLIKNPVERGHSWPSTQGATATVQATGLRVKTDAGAFTRCVRIVESGGTQGRQVTTVYCPRVGPVYVLSKMSLTVAEAGTVEVTAKLRGYRTKSGSSVQ